MDVENPFNDSPEIKTYAQYFEKEFEESIVKFGIDMDYRHQAEMYRSGKYVEHILHALRKRGEIFDILDSHRTQDAQEGEREAYYPVSIYCPVCGKDTTKIHSLSDDCTVAQFSCECGHSGEFDFTKDFNCKLAWKIDWPMRWMYEGVDFEPGGKDHAARNGSYDTSKDISKAIFGYDLDSPEKDLSYSTLDSAPYVPKSVVVDDNEYDWGDDKKPDYPMSESIIYETHLRGATKLNPFLPDTKRGTFAGFTDDSTVNYLKHLGITAVELLPVHAFFGHRHKRGYIIDNYWGYESFSFFAPEQSYLSEGGR